MASDASARPPSAASEIDPATIVYPSEDVARCPYPHFEALRQGDPVHPVPGRPNEYVVTRHADILTVLRETDLYSAAYSVTENGVQRAATLEDIRSPDAVRGVSASDPPKHTLKRKLAFNHLKPARIREQLPKVEQIVDALIATFAARGQVEFISEFAILLPSKVILAILGLPDEDVERVTRWSGFEGQATRYHDQQRQDQVYALVRDMGAYLEDAIVDRYENPRDDVLSAFIADHVAANGGELDLPNVRADTTNLVNGGTITTAHMLGNTMRRLLDDADLVERGREDSRVFVRAIEESLRLEAPVQYMPRVAVADTKLGGVTIAAGSHLLLAYASANRDEAKFDGPDEFDIDRPNVKEHLAFGNNLHFCMGAPLAREEGRIAFERLFALLANLRLADRNDYEPIDSLAFRGLRELWLDFDPA